jgi:hypothetical protein
VQLLRRHAANYFASGSVFDRVCAFTREDSVGFLLERLLKERARHDLDVVRL